jgi:Amt family ammonium transporter
MFAAITIALITGGLAERMRFGPWLVFIPIWMVLIYAPLANWVWGGGWLAQLGALDFAGGIVVHLSAAFGSLASALILGRRLGFGTPTVMAGHNVPYQFLALFLLWFGWNGFNGGSALAANGIAVSAIVATNLAAAGAGLSTVLLGWAVTKKPSSSLGANGPIAGLAAVTPASGYIEPWAGLVIGLIAGIVFYVGVLFFKNRLKVDDVCDVIAIHGMTCVWGTLSVAIFASPMITGSVSGLVYGSTELVGPQAVGTATGAAFGFVGTYVILRVINAVTPIRIKPDQEEIGEDISLHGEESYRLT